MTSKYGPYLELVPADKVAVITIHEVLSLVMRPQGRSRFVNVALALGAALQAEVNLAHMTSEPKRRAALSLLRTRSVGGINLLARRAEDGVDWDRRLQVKLGGEMVRLMFENTFVEVDGEQVPAFHHDKEYARSGRRYVDCAQPFSAAIAVLTPVCAVCCDLCVLLHVVLLCSVRR